MAEVVACPTCGVVTEVPSCPSCGAELLAGAGDHDQTASDRDQTRSEQEQTASDQDQTWSDRDQSSSDSDQRSAEDDQHAADDDLAAGGDAVAHRRSSEARERSSHDRDDMSSLREESAASRLHTADDRDRSADRRDDEADATRDDVLLRAQGDRARAAADRLRAADDRARAAADREEAARERAEALRSRSESADILKLATTDELTGSWTRKFGLEQVVRELERAQRTGAGLVLAFIDVDGLKAVNDSRGHLAGDALLQLVGETLKTNLRRYDVIVRYGGDEFVCAMPNLSVSEARTRFERIAAALRALDEEHSVTFGLAAAEPAVGLEELIARADTDLLRAKRAGQKRG